MNSLVRKLYAILLLLASCGCATPEQRAAQVLADYGPYCDKLGYQRDTDVWRQCVQLEDAKNSSYGVGPYMNSPWWGGAAVRRR